MAGGNGLSYTGAERLNQAFFHSAKSISQEEFWESWVDTVIDYSRREASFEDDKLVALSSIASEFQKIGHSTYLAGLWRQDLLKLLMWMLDPSVNQVMKPRPSVYVASSWSWASVNGTVAFGATFKRDQFYAEILRCENTLEDDELPTGKVVAGLLELRGQMRETRWSGTTLL